MYLSFIYSPHTSVLLIRIQYVHTTVCTELCKQLVDRKLFVRIHFIEHTVAHSNSSYDCKKWN